MQMNKWYRQVLAGGKSSNGRPYFVTFKRGASANLLVNFFGGGASWNEDTAGKSLSVGALLGLKEGYYIDHIPPYVMGAMHVGILKAKDARNPFDDWSVLQIHYATADFHLGNHDFEHAQGKVLHHHGQKNVELALDFLKAFFPDTPEKLVISGSSAGGFGCLAHSPAVQALYPDCQHVLVYSEGTHLHTELWPTIAQDIWKVSPHLLPYIKGPDLIGDLFRYAKDHLPKDTVFLHANTVWDKTLVQFMNKLNHDKMTVNEQGLHEFHNSLLAVTAQLKKEIPTYYFFLTDMEKNKQGTTPHTFAGSKKLLYERSEAGITLAEWLRRALENRPFDVGTQFLEEDL